MAEQGDMATYYYCDPHTMTWTRQKCGTLTICVRKENWLGRHCRFRFNPFALAS